MARQLKERILVTNGITNLCQLTPVSAVHSSTAASHAATSENDSQSRQACCDVAAVHAMQSLVVFMQAATSQSQPGASLIDLTQPAAQAGYLDPATHAEDISDEMADGSVQPDDASNMSEELLEQSGYPTDPSDEEEDQSGQTLNPTSEEAEDGRRERWRGMVYSNVENDVPEGNVNVQRGGDLTFLAAVKKQSKVKEGDWSEVKQQHDTNDNEDGMVDID